jgi:pimeloyl-ACP methyl ester carboxylesterase
MGGGVAATLAMKRPDRVRGLALVGSVGAPAQRPPTGARRLLGLVASPWLRPIFRDLDIRALARRALAAAYRDPALVTAAVVSRYVDLSRAPGHRDILLNRAAQPAPPPEAFRRLGVPTLVMHGEADALVPASSGRWLAGAIPAAKLVTYPDVGHVPMEQIPDRSAEDLAAFVESLSTPGGPAKPPARRQRVVKAPKTSRSRVAGRKPR